MTTSTRIADLNARLAALPTRPPALSARVADLNDRLAAMPEHKPSHRSPSELAAKKRARAVRTAKRNADQADKRHKQQAAADQRARREQVAVTLNTTATCRSCQATKPQEEFPKTQVVWSTRRSSWVQRYASTCTECSP